MSKSTLLSTFLLLGFLGETVFAQEPGACGPPRTAVIHINGVDTDPAGTFRNKKRLEQVWRLAQTGPIETTIEFSHNPTRNLLFDLIETFQRTPEYTNDPLTIPDILDALFGRNEAAAVELVDVILGILVNSPVFNQTSGPVVATLVGDIRGYLYSGHRVLLVPHSQGNLMALDAYGQLNTEEQKYVEVLAIASPAATAIGPRELSTLDQIISLTPGAPYTTFEGEFSSDDVLGHNFQAIYLAEGSRSLSRIGTAFSTYATTAPFPQDSSVICPSETGNSARLSNLEVSDVQLEPTFDPDVLNYRGTVDDAISSVTVTPTWENPNASVFMNGLEIASGTGVSINIALGNNFIFVAVMDLNADPPAGSNYEVNLVKGDPPLHTWSGPGVSDSATRCTNIELDSVASDGDFQLSASGDESFLSMGRNSGWTGSGSYSVFMSIGPKKGSFEGYQGDGTLTITEVVDSQTGIPTYNGTWESIDGQWVGEFDGVGLDDTPFSCN